MTRVTLKDVAARAGVSYQTVSKVMNGNGTVSEETEARIWQSVEELEYRPNVAARNLRTQASNLVGHALPEHPRHFYFPILQEFVTSAAYSAEHEGYHLLSFVMPGDNFYDTGPYDRLFDRRQVAGFMLSNTQTNDPRVRHLIEQQIPFCSFGRANDNWDFCWVDVDGQHGTELTTRHLLEQGHRRIGFITWPEGSQTGADRERGYRLALQEAGIAIDEAWIARGENVAQDGRYAVQKLLSLPAGRRPTGVVCVSDMMAIGAIHGAIAEGLEVGRQFAITGFDDMPLVEFVHPPLTSVRQPIEAVGERVMELLLKQINGQPIGHKGILLKPELVIRQSS